MMKKEKGLKERTVKESSGGSPSPPLPFIKKSSSSRTQYSSSSSTLSLALVGTRTQSTPRRPKLQRSERILILKSANPEVTLSITTALLRFMVRLIPLVAAQLTQHTHNPIIVLVALAVPLAAGVRRSRIVHGVAEFRPLALLVRRLGVGELSAGDVGGV
jgi:hypothetical protein